MTNNKQLYNVPSVNWFTKMNFFITVRSKIVLNFSHNKVVNNVWIYRKLHSKYIGMSSSIIIDE